MIGNGARPLWVIARQDDGQMQVLTLRHRNRETLPIFSFEDEAEMFLQLETPETYWRARETTLGELVSLLYGPCASVKSVALDPLPLVDQNLMCRGRNEFVRYILNGHKTCNSSFQTYPKTPAPPSCEEKMGCETRTSSAKAARHKTVESVGEAANGKNEALIPDYTVLDFDPIHEPRGLSGVRKSGDHDDLA